MPRTCTICAHKDREVIDEALVAKESLRNIAERFETSATSLHRHKQDHLPLAITKAKETQEALHSANLLEQLQDLNRKVYTVLDQAERASDHRILLAAVREARSNMVFVAEVLVRLKEKTPEQLILLVKDERDLPPGRAVPVVRSDEDLEAVHQGRAHELPQFIPQDATPSLPAPSLEIRVPKPTAPHALPKPRGRWMGVDKAIATMDGAEARVRDRAGLMGPRHFGPPE